MTTFSFFGSADFWRANRDLSAVAGASLNLPAAAAADSTHWHFAAQDSNMELMCHLARSCAAFLIFRHWHWLSQHNIVELMCHHLARSTCEAKTTINFACLRLLL